MYLIEQWREKMDQDVEKLERRRSFRVPVQGTASLWKRGNYIGNYEVQPFYQRLSFSGHTGMGVESSVYTGTADTHGNGREY